MPTGRSGPAPGLLLVTGATGVLGPSVLAAFGPGRCIALRHRTPVLGGGVEVLTGDLTRERLGLSPQDYRRLLPRLGGVLHAGALTTTTWSAAELERTNVGGTRNAVRLAEDAGVPLHHVSTFYVHGRDATLTSEPTNPYQATKREAERIVAAAAVPTATYRLPILIGDADTGVVTRFRGQGLYVGAKTIVGGNAHLLPAPTPCWVDFLPRDHVAECLRIAVDAHLAGTYWITAGRAAIPLGQFVDICLEIAAELGRTVARPKIVDPEVVERLILPAFSDLIPAELRLHLRVANRVALGMANAGHLPDSRDDLPAGVRFPALPDLVACLRRSLRYWAAHVTLRPPVLIPEPSR